MAIFTDGSIATVADLKAYESSILDVAITEGVDLEHKLDLAKREIGLELGAFLVRKGGSSGHEKELARVVVTEPLLHWHTVHALALVYRDAYNSQLNDRYRGKWQEFAAVSDRAQRLLEGIGVGMTHSPIAKAPAPALGSVGGSLLPVSTYYVKIAWQGPSSVTGAWSDTVVATIDPGMRLTVTVPEMPAGVLGAIIYAGEFESELYRQNESIVAARATWTQASSGMRKDLPPLRIQAPDYYVGNRREMLRG